MGLFSWLFGPKPKEWYDDQIEALELQNKDWQETINQRIKSIPPKAWRLIQGWSYDKIREQKLKMKHGELKDQLKGELIYDHLVTAEEILKFRERIATIQHEIEQLKKDRAKHYGMELQPA